MLASLSPGHICGFLYEALAPKSYSNGNHRHSRSCLCASVERQSRGQGRPLALHGEHEFWPHGLPDSTSYNTADDFKGKTQMSRISESKVLNGALFNLLTLLVAKHHKRMGQQYGRRSIDNISDDSWGWTEEPPQHDRELWLRSKSLGTLCGTDSRDLGLTLQEKPPSSVTKRAMKLERPETHPGICSLGCSAALGARNCLQVNSCVGCALRNSIEGEAPDRRETEAVNTGPAKPAAEGRETFQSPCFCLCHSAFRTSFPHL